jgi:cysteine desulfurase / selenocysteine lyase
MTEDKTIHYDVQKIRKDFPILSTEMNGKPLVFLDSAASSQKPLCVIEALSHYYQYQHANVHRGVYELSQRATDLFESSRKRVQSFLGAKEECEIIFTRGATESINLVASSFGKKFIGEKDLILVSGLEHHSNLVPWLMVAEAQKAQVKIIPVLDNGELDMAAYEDLLTEGVKLVAVNHVSNSLGTINPVKQMIKAAHKVGAAVLVDGAQSTPHMKIDVQDLDVDFYVFSSHKVYGPTGIGVLYGKEKWLEAMPPYHGGGEMIDRVSYTDFTTNVLPFKFEAGTPNIADAIALEAALDYVEDLGQERIARHENQLLAYATAQMNAIEGMRIYGTAPHKASVISFLVEEVHPYDLGALLDKQGVAVRTGHHCTQPLMDRFGIPGTVRASFGLYTSKEDIDILVASLKKALTLLR